VQALLKFRSEFGSKSKRSTCPTESYVGFTDSNYCVLNGNTKIVDDIQFKLQLKTNEEKSWASNMPFFDKMAGSGTEIIKKLHPDL
jgi:hypothetical protein